jgi:hypothetical protein
MAHLIPYAVVWLAGYVLLVWWRPHMKRCPKCKGKRVLFKSGRRPRTCPRCRGTGGPVRRYGAPLVHRAYQSLAGDSLRERRRERLKGEKK